MMNGKILIIGGYGNVGRIIATELSKRLPKHVIVAGRDYQKAKDFSLELNQQVIPMALDISRISVNEEFLEDVGIVVMCLDMENIEFARLCIQRGIHYIDISASYSILSQIEMLNKEAEMAGATVVLSVGLAPGLTNLLTKHCQSKVPNMTYSDIYILLGMGDIHGDAALQWTLKNLDGAFTICNDGEIKRVKSFEDVKQTVFPKQLGKRNAYRFNFSDQHVLPKTLGLKSVSTRFCFDSAWMTMLLAILTKAGISRLLSIKGVEGFLVGLLKQLHFGSAEFVVKVEGSTSQEQGDLYECSLWGEVEGRVTGLVAAKVAENLVLSSYPSGVFHIEQLFTLHEFLENLGQHGLEFEEKEYVPA
ncbi:MAG: saccharopine dehydrogenase NADP-binding domain-containing protein [Thermosynechococcaceae cyanobacterium]